MAVKTRYKIAWIQWAIGGEYELDDWEVVSVLTLTEQFGQMLVLLKFVGK